MNFRKLAVSYVHNCVAHQLLFLADILDELGYAKASLKLDAFHDWTASFYEPPFTVWNLKFFRDQGDRVGVYNHLLKKDPHVSSTSLSSSVDDPYYRMRVEFRAGFDKPQNPELHGLNRG